MPWLRWLANAFVVGYAADAGLSVLDEALRAATGSTLLLAPRNALARLVLWAALWMPVALALTPRLPTALFLLLSLSALWLGSGAAPLALLVAAPAPVATAIQAAIAALAFVWIRLRNRGAGWLLRPEALAGRDFSPAHSLGFVAGALLLGLPALALYLAVLAATTIQVATQGFVAFDLAGVSLADRRYTRGDHEVRLVGMMHVGEEERYRALARSFGGAGTIVLQEGVTDERARLRTQLSYGRVAALLGLEEQDDLAGYLADEGEPAPADGPVFVHADLDLADFAPETIAWLEQAAAVYGADEPWAALRAFGDWSAARAEQWPILERDLFTRRNEHLLARLDEALAASERVVVPWGALHLPAIEAGLVARGFERTRAEEHRLLGWRGIAERLLGAE